MELQASAEPVMKILAMCNESFNDRDSSCVLQPRRRGSCSVCGDIAQKAGLLAHVYAAACRLRKSVRFLLNVRLLNSQQLSTLATVVARSQSNFPPEQSGKMARVRIADFESDVDHAQVRLAQQPARLVHSQVDLIVRW